MTFKHFVHWCSSGSGSTHRAREDGKKTASGKVSWPCYLCMLTALSALSGSHAGGMAAPRVSHRAQEGCYISSDTEHLFIFLSGNQDISAHPCSKIWLLLPTVTQQLSCYSSAHFRELLHQLRISFQGFQACLPHPHLLYSFCLRAGGTEHLTPGCGRMGRAF